MTATLEGAPRRSGSVGGCRPLSTVDVLVPTYNSAATLRESLDSVRRFVPVHCLIVVDRSSTDETGSIARSFGARLLWDDVGLGSARNAALRAADTDPVLFVDSDVRIVDPEFWPKGRAEWSQARTAAVVGQAVGHSFRYGLPLGLTLVGREFCLRARMPDRAQGRETYYLQGLVRREGLRVRYVQDAMIHHGTYRHMPHWPEFQGASIRAAAGLSPREVAYAAMVILLMHMNSKRAGNVLYSPVLFGKLVRGFLHPDRWGRLTRSRRTGRPATADSARLP